MRFNAPEYLEAWKANGLYPRIHKNIFNLITEHGQGGKMLDLCCSTGLLGLQVNDTGKYDTIGLDSDKTAIAFAKHLGNPMPIYEMKIDRTNLDAFMDIIKLEGITAIAARRCIPELFGDDLPCGITWITGIAEFGVEEIFLEGRVKTKNAVNHFDSIEKEINFFSLDYDLVTQNGNVAYLRRKA